MLVAEKKNLRIRLDDDLKSHLMRLCDLTGQSQQTAVERLVGWLASMPDETVIAVLSRPDSQARKQIMLAALHRLDPGQPIEGAGVQVEQAVLEQRRQRESRPKEGGKPRQASG